MSLHYGLPECHVSQGSWLTGVSVLLLVLHSAVFPAGYHLLQRVNFETDLAETCRSDLMGSRCGAVE